MSRKEEGLMRMGTGFWLACSIVVLILGLIIAVVGTGGYMITVSWDVDKDRAEACQELFEARGWQYSHWAGKECLGVDPETGSRKILLRE